MASKDIVEIMETIFTIIPFIAYFAFVIAIVKVVKKAKKAVKLSSDEKRVETSQKQSFQPMSKERLRAMSEHNQRQVERAGKANRPDTAIPINRAEKVGHSNQREALNLKTTATGVHIDKSTTSNTMRLRKEMEDRANDWLASQLRYERNISRNNGLDIGFSHSVSCDSELLRREHRANCDDKTVDDGVF